MRPAQPSQHEAVAAGYPGSGTWSSAAEHRGPDLGQLIARVLRELAVALRVGLDPQRPQQVRGGPARVSAIAQDRMQTLRGQVVEHQIDHAPRVERFLPVLIRSAHRRPPHTSLHQMAPEPKVPSQPETCINEVAPTLPVTT